MNKPDRLRKFRRQCEKEASKPADQIQVPLLHALSDVCKTLGLTRSQKRKVLGRRGITRLEHLQEWRVSIRKDAADKR
jgi:hypothetical protein